MLDPGRKEIMTMSFILKFSAIPTVCKKRFHASF
jgi:hypothetical protein